VKVVRLNVPTAEPALVLDIAPQPEPGQGEVFDRSWVRRRSSTITRRLHEISLDLINWLTISRVTRRCIIRALSRLRCTVKTVPCRRVGQDQSKWNS
jgi:hypothetical protein